MSSQDKLFLRFSYNIGMMQDENTVIGSRVRAARESVGLTQGELGDYLGGLSKTSISKIEAGQNALTLKNLMALPEILDRPVVWFLGIDTGYSDIEVELCAILRSYRSDLTKETLLGIARTLQSNDHNTYPPDDTTTDEQ
jgi:transcriptional regulator with XRE-family HTH domain